jgi:hypothetical protein
MDTAAAAGALAVQVARQGGQALFLLWSLRAYQHLLVRNDCVLRSWIHSACTRHAAAAAAAPPPDLFCPRLILNLYLLEVFCPRLILNLYLLELRGPSGAQGCAQCGLPSCTKGGAAARNANGNARGQSHQP